VSAPPSPALPSAKSSRWSLLVIVILLLALTAVSAGWYLTSQRSAETTEAVSAPQPILPPPALYYALEPAFLVNLEPSGFDSPRYLQVEVQLMTRDPRVHAALEQHAPALRSRLLFLFDQQHIDDLDTREDKEALQNKALEEVRHLIQAETGSDAIEALLFTSFVTQ